MSAIHIQEAVQRLKRGELVILPTETVYGLAGNAFDAQAVARIFEAKRRPTFNPLIVHVASLAELQSLTQNVNPLAFALAERFWPGALTLVLPKSDRVSDLVTAGSPCVAVRIPSHPVMQQVLAQLAFPLAAPSANPSSGLSPTRVEDLSPLLKDIGYVDGGPSRLGLESTIIDLSGAPRCLRLGAIPLEEIEAVTGALPMAAAGEVLAPGMLKKHYSPSVPVRVFSSLEKVPPYPQAALLSPFPTSLTGFRLTEILSPASSLREAAANLFQALHRLEKAKPECIFALLAPEEGLGRAINDRLRRAAAE